MPSAMLTCPPSGIESPSSRRGSACWRENAALSQSPFPPPATIQPPTRHLQRAQNSMRRKSRKKTAPINIATQRARRYSSASFRAIPSPRERVRSSALSRRERGSRPKFVDANKASFRKRLVIIFQQSAVFRRQFARVIFLQRLLLARTQRSERCLPHFALAFGLG